MNILTNKEMEDMAFGSNVTKVHDDLRMFLSNATSEFSKVDNENGSIVDALVINDIGINIEGLIGPSYNRLTKITNIDDTNTNYGIWVPVHNKMFAGVLLSIVDEDQTSWGTLFTFDGRASAFSRLQDIDTTQPINPYSLLENVMPVDALSNIVHMNHVYTPDVKTHCYTFNRTELTDDSISVQPFESITLTPDEGKFTNDPELLKMYEIALELVELTSGPDSGTLSATKHRESLIAELTRINNK